jgi:hypothetical protein
VFAVRRKSRVESTGAQRGYLDCTECQRTVSEVDRLGMRCGWLPRLPDAETTLVIPPAAPEPACGTCPGFLMRLPEVGQAFTAHLWWDKGQLREHVAGHTVSPLLNLYVEHVVAAIAERDTEQEVEAERSRKAAEARARR